MIRRLFISILIATTPLTLSGCALFGASPENAQARSNAPSTDLTVRRAVRPDIEPASYRARAAPPVYSRPVPLSPCRDGASLTENCRRAGDEHFVFPAPAPDNVVAMPARNTPPAPLEISGQ